LLNGDIVIYLYSTNNLFALYSSSDSF